MGFCDLIPGISGATIAYLFGIYPRLLKALHSMNAELIKTLFFFRFSKLQQIIDIKFVICLGFGIVLSLFTFCHLVRALLMNPYSYSCLIGLFFGLVGVMTIYQLQSLQKRFFMHSSFILVGFFAFYVFHVVLETVQITHSAKGAILPVWIVGGSICAITGLLPGISGMFVLFLMGLYRPLLDALCFAPLGDRSSLFVLGNFTIGVLIGLWICSRSLYWLLKKYEAKTEFFLVGFTLAAVSGLTKNLYMLQGWFFFLSLLFVFVGFIIASTIKTRYYEPS